MPLYKDNRNGRLFVQFNFQKQTYKRYLPDGASRTDGKKLETKMRADLLFQAHGIQTAKDVLFEDFVAGTFLPDCETNLSRANFDKADRLCIEALPFLKGKILRHVTPSDIEAFKSYRIALPTIHGRKRKPATIARELAILSKLFSVALKNNYCDYNPVARVDRPKYDNIQTRVLARADDERFFAAFDGQQGEMARDICRLVLNTGLRQNDALGLSDFHLIDARTIRLIQGKTKRTVEIPLNATASVIVAKYSGNGLLFPSPKTGKPMHYIRQAIKGACKRAGIEPVSIRDLRRTFATRLAEDGADALTISLLLGHSDLRMIHRYARSTEAMRKAVELIEQSTLCLPEPRLRIAK
jgi:integrase